MAAPVQVSPPEWTNFHFGGRSASGTSSSWSSSCMAFPAVQLTRRTRPGKHKVPHPDFNVPNAISDTSSRLALATARCRARSMRCIGRDVLDRQQRQGWGAGVIDRLARDLKAAFPDMRGFSPRNLKYMRALAQAWPEPEFVQQPIAMVARCDAARPARRPESPRVVRAPFARTRLVAQHPGHADRNTCPCA